MLETTHTKLTKLEDKKLNTLMDKVQAGQDITEEEQDILFKGLLK